MNVISFPRWRVFSYLDEHGKNAIREWLDTQHVPTADRIALQMVIDLFEGGGPGVVLSCIQDLGDGFQALVCPRKAGCKPSLIFRHGSASDFEITLLAGARMDRRRFWPKYQLGVAHENWEELKRNPRRRRREPVA